MISLVDSTLKFTAATAIEYGWQKSKINVLFGKVRGSSCPSQERGFGSCSENILAAFRNPKFSFFSALRFARTQFSFCRHLDTKNYCVGGPGQ